MFDQLIILDVGGYPIYKGDPVDAVVYFKKLQIQRFYILKKKLLVV